MPMFNVIKPVYRAGYPVGIFRVEWDFQVAIQAPTASEAIAIAKKAGHLTPILDDFRSPEQRERDHQMEVDAFRTSRELEAHRVR